MSLKKKADTPKRKTREVIPLRDLVPRKGVKAGLRKKLFLGERVDHPAEAGTAAGTRTEDHSK